MVITTRLKKLPSKLLFSRNHPFASFSQTLSARSNLPHYKDNPDKAKDNWNTNHSFVLSNPILSLLENKCKSISQLKQIQSQMIITGLISDGLASSRLIAFCALSEMADLSYCKTLLCSLQNPNAFSYNVSIRAFSDGENPIEAFILYKQMLCAWSNSGLRPDKYTFPLLFKTCTRLSFFYLGFEILVHVIKLGYERNIYVHNALIHFLASFGELDIARMVFNENCVRDLVSWNSLINGYVKSGKAHKALRIFREMETEGVKPDEVTMIGLVLSCGQLEDLVLGREFHQRIEEYGLNLTVPLGNALMDMYVKCGELDEAKALFDRMEKKTVVSWTTMVVGYAKMGLLDTARKLFDEMPEKDVVPWNALISGYVQIKHCKEALALFSEMQAMNVMPDQVTMVSCLSACTQIGALDVGIWLHRYIERNNISINVALGTALIDMYAKCGNISKALQIFKEMPARNSLTWTAIICGLAYHGDSSDALSHFFEMIQIGLVPDEVTFLGVLSACCHGGLVEEGRKIFAQMSSKFNIPPKLKHYSCMVDLLGRAGLLEEAEELIKSMPMEADAVVWGALFFACRINKNVEMGEKAAMKLLELDPHDSGIYVLLASMYIEANMWHKSREVRKMMRERGVDKTPGCSSIEVKGDVWEFMVKDKSHPQCDEIYQCLMELKRQMELVEYSVDVPLPEYDLLISSNSCC
ncbi:pentatricopeptide repeat-containing protein At2g22410, mitochondrial-like [Coffea arabica]|uniref:Pentatricopeptide repeat-containing protein At2g22410, mitochondrial-like n=1 Tax=Coffea arabica TaxID=13443 RepID=A0A6P6VCI0_COFAR|nr:pentatricopeptide repeat-containing protein At2g22410, mitochondrial-like [Coffea arabica]